MLKLLIALVLGMAIGVGGSVVYILWKFRDVFMNKPQ